jgi:hypothetical protein
LGRKATLTVETPPAPPPVRVVSPGAVYLAAEFRQLFGLKASSLRREVREGRLIVSKRCGKYFVVGSRILEWLAAGEVNKGAANGT